MHKFKSKTPVGNEIEWELTFAVGDLKSVSDRLAFIRHGLTDPDDIKGAMGVLHLVEDHLDDLILDIKGNIEKVIELDAIAAGEAPFIPQSCHENEAIEALKRARAGDFDLSLSKTLCRAVILAEAAFKKRCKSILIGDDDVAAVVESASADQTPEGANHAK